MERIPITSSPESARMPIPGAPAAGPAHPKRPLRGKPAPVRGRPGEPRPAQGSPETPPASGEAAREPSAVGAHPELPPITSSQNRQISFVRRLLAKPRECRKEGVLVADGIHLVQEAMRAGLPCRSLFITVADRNPEIRAIAEKAAEQHLPVYRVLDHLFRTFSPVETPEGVLGVFQRPALKGGKLWGAGRPMGHLAVTHLIQDPSNLGALTRSALAAGFQGLVTTPGTVDPYHHRALRASMGAAFHLPIRMDQPALPLIATLRNLGYRTVALSPRAQLDLADLPPLAPTALFLGSEGGGLDPAVERAVELCVRIPMHSDVESLGVAAAGAISFFWLRLAGRNGRGPHGAPS